MQLLLCKGTLDLSGATATCTEWATVEASLLLTPSSTEEVTAALLLEAIGGGIVVGLPLAMALFGIKYASKAINKS
jgi:hypothetical protein